MSDKASTEGVQKPRSCADCPSFLAAGDEATEYLKSSPGFSTCARFGHVFDSMGMTAPHRRKILREKALKCPEYGEPRPQHIDAQRMQFSVSLPNIDAVTHMASNLDQTTVDSCLKCQWLTPMSHVQRQYGWRAGICNAKGKLISNGRAVYEQRGCPNKREGGYPGATFIPIRDVQLNPELRPDYAPTSDPLKAFQNAQANFIDPFDFPTDMKVEPEDAKAGIRAWRAIEDFKTGNIVMLPVYQPESFDPRLQDLIPRTGDDEHPEKYLDYSNLLYKIAVTWRALDETPTLWGIPGTGKTEAYRWLAWLMCAPFHRISITASSELDDLLGKMMYDPERGTYFQEGRLVRAWQQPGVMCIDEPNTGPVEVWQMLRPLTDNSKQLVLDQADGRRIARNPDSYVGFAMNPAWDARNIGALPLADADTSRLMHVKIELPPEPVEREIIRNRCLGDGFNISDAQLRMILGISRDVRSLSDEGAFEGSWGIRNSVKTARLLAWLDIEDAVAMAVTDSLEPAQVQGILDIARTHRP